MTVPEHTRFGDKQLQRLSEQTRNEFERLQRMPFHADGAELITFGPKASAGAFIFSHSLKRVPQGWLVVYVKLPAGSNTDWSLYYRAEDQWDASSLALYTTGAFDLLRVWLF